MTVLVIGATGLVGSVVVEGLVEAGVPVRALTRLPENAHLPEDKLGMGSPTVAEALVNQSIPIPLSQRCVPYQ